MEKYKKEKQYRQLTLMTVCHQHTRHQLFLCVLVDLVSGLKKHNK